MEGTEMGHDIPEAAAPSSAPAVRPRGRWLRRQFSLATLLLLTLAAGSGIELWLNWQAWTVNRDFTDYVSSVRFSKDGATCVLSGSKPVELDAHTGKPTGGPALATFRNCVTADGERAAEFVQVMNAPARIEIHNTRTGAVEQILDCPTLGDESHFSADGERLFVSGFPFGVRVYRRHQQSNPEAVLKGVDATPEPDDGGGNPPRAPNVRSAEEEQQLRVCVRAVNDATTLQEQESAATKLEAIPHSRTRVEVLLSSADLAVSRVVSDGAAKAFTWDLDTGKRGAELINMPGEDTAGLEFSKDGRYIGTVDPTQGRAFVWELATGRVSMSWKVSDTPLAYCNFAFSAGGRCAVTQSDPDSRTKLWACATGRLIKELPAGGIGFLAFSPDGERIVCDGDGTRDELLLFDTASGAQLCALPRPSAPCGLSVTYAPDGRSMAVIANNPAGNETRFFCRHHPENALGILALPGSWVLMGIGLLLGWRVVRAVI